MAEKRKLEFFLLRYVPDAVKGEFVNIGVVMFESGETGGGFADVRFTRDWRRVRCLDPQADVGVLVALEREIRNQLMEIRDRDLLIRRIEDSFSNLVQVSGVKGCLSENPAEELTLLTRLYLKRRIVGSLEEAEAEAEPERHTGRGRSYILGEMQRAFEEAGIWKLLMHGVPVSPYSHPKDPFKVDFGYKTGTETKLFHAVSMSANIDSAVLLATRYHRIQPVMAQLTATTPFLTAVVETGLDKGKNEIAFAVEIMEENRIRVATTDEMPDIATVARAEMG